MSKLKKVGTILFFLFSIGAVISTLRIIGNIEENRKEIDSLTVSLQEKNEELTQVRKEKASVEDELEKEKELKEEMRKELNQKIEELQGKVKEEQGKTVVWKNKFADLEKEKTELENKYKGQQQVISSLQEMLKKSSPNVAVQTANVPSLNVSSLPSKKIEGEVMVVADPFLSLRLGKEAVAGFQPRISIYRKGKLVKEFDSRGVRWAALIVKVGDGESLEGIKESDRVDLSLSPEVTKLFNTSRVEGKVLNVVRPGFLNINLGKEYLEDVQPILLVYRNGELFRKIKLKDIDRLTIVVEAAEGTSVKDIRGKDKAILIP